MKTCISSKRGRAPVRLCASALAFFAAFPVLAQGQSAGTLEAVMVTATRFAEPADVLPFGVSVITKEDIQRAGVITVNDALVKLLGVPGRTDFYGSGDYGLDLRGFGTTASSNQVVVLDGIRLNEADLSGARLSGIAIDSIEKIEVIRGSGSVLYGEGATGGVIVITTKAGAGSERKNTANIYTAAGSDGLREIRAGATLASGGFSIDVSGNKRDTDNHRDNFKSSVDGSAATAQWSNDWLRFGASYANDTLDSGLPGSLTTLQYAANPFQAKTTDTSGKIVNTRQTLFAQADVSGWQLGMDVGQRSKSLDSLKKGVSTYSYDVDANTFAIRAKRESMWNSARNAITFGRDQAQWERTSFGVVSDQKSRALYAQNDLTLHGGTRLSVGYRSENISQADSSNVLNTDQRQTAWNIGLTQPISKSWSVFGRVGSSFRLANIDELGYTMGGIDLQPQTSRDFELGSRWTYEASRVELRYYRNKLDNELGYDSTVANPQPWNPLNKGANVNFDPTLRQGLELETHYSLSKTLALQGNLGIREGKFTDGPHTRKTVPLVAATTVAVRANWQPLPAHSVNAGVVWVSKQNVDFGNTCKVPAYALADARYAHQMGNAELSLGISNLFDKKYFNLAYGCDAGAATSIYPEAGRAFTAALRIKF